jgi:hypothetical protein
MRRAGGRIGEIAIVLVLATLTPAAIADAPAAGAELTEVTNPTPVLISKDNSCCTAQPASPYPSSISVTGVSGITTEAEVTLWGLHESDAEGLQVLLVGPSGRSIVLMASYESGRHVSLNSTSWGFRTLSQPVECPEPEGTWSTASVTEPFNCGLRAPFPEPAPVGPYSDMLEALGNAGEWKLYVANAASDGEGAIVSGWSLKLRTTPVVALPATSDGPEALEHAGLAAKMQFAQFEAERAQREREAREAIERERAEHATAPAPPCVVPALAGHSLHGAKRLLVGAHCRVGHVTVRRHSRETLVVVHQSAARGRRLVSGAAVAVVLGARSDAGRPY